jgi:hypothetical protein
MLPALALFSRGACGGENSKRQAVISLRQIDAPAFRYDIGAGRGAVGLRIQLPDVPDPPQARGRGATVGKLDHASTSFSRIGKFVDTRDCSPMTGIQMRMRGLQNQGSVPAGIVPPGLSGSRGRTMIRH